MNPDAREQVTGVVLAGGESTRFGEPNKAVARIDDAPLIRRVVDTVRTAFRNAPVVAVRSRSQRDRVRNALADPDDVQFVFDADDFEGPIAGTIAASRAVQTPWMFVTGCDMPLLDEEAIAAVWEARGTDADAVVPVDADGRPEPLHAGYRRSAIREYRRDARPNAGLRALVSSLESVTKVQFEPGSVLAESTANVNTQSELHRLPGRTEVVGSD